MFLHECFYIARLEDMGWYRTSLDSSQSRVLKFDLERRKQFDWAAKSLQFHEKLSAGIPIFGIPKLGMVDGVQQPLGAVRRTL